MTAELKVIDIHTEQITKDPNAAFAALLDPAVVEPFVPFWRAEIVTSMDIHTGEGATEQLAIAAAEADMKFQAAYAAETAQRKYWEDRGQGIY